MKKTQKVDVVLQVKGNQQKLLKKCEDLMKKKCPCGKFTEHGKRARGRIEKRTTKVFHKNNFDLGDIWNDSVKTIVQIKRETRIFDTKEKKYFESGETALYISTAVLSAKEFSSVIRSHWRIENSNHYVKDVSFHEDFSRVRKNPENVATLRSFAMNLLRSNNEKNMSQALYRNAVNVRRVFAYAGIREGFG